MMRRTLPSPRPRRPRQPWRRWPRGDVRLEDGSGFAKIVVMSTRADLADAETEVAMSEVGEAQAHDDYRAAEAQSPTRQGLTHAAQHAERVKSATLAVETDY